jgi:HAE1 family hydrophobic/amphiphilic exporter-1
VIDDEAARDRTRPQLDLVAAYARRGLAGAQNPDLDPPFPVDATSIPDAIDGGLGRSYGTIREGRFPDASVGLALTVPLGNRAARADAAVARSSRTQAELALLRTRQAVEVEVRNAAVALETAGQRLAAARAGRTAAETQLTAEEERFAAGLSTSFFVLTRQNDLTQAKLAETAALADLRKAHVEWARATGTLLAERRIETEKDEPATSPDGGTR